MPGRIFSWLPVAALLCLLAVAPAQGSDGTGARDVPIMGTELSLRVPQGVVVVPDTSASTGVATLLVEGKAAQSFPRNGVITRAEVLAQRAALARSQAKVVDVWEEVGLADIVPLPTGGCAVIYPFYSEFEICDLRFTMNAAFFVGDRQVIIRYSASPAAIITENPSFFGHDQANCGDAAVWMHPGPDAFTRFHKAAKAGRLGPAANAWYADFLAILASLHRQVPSR